MADWAETVLELYFITQHKTLDSKCTIDFLMQNKRSDAELQRLIIHEL